MGLIFPKLWLPPTPRLVRGPGGGLLRKTGSSALAKDESCCCGPTENDCNVFRGNADSGDVHTHYPYVKARFPAWGDANTFPTPSGSVDNACCAELDADYELPIRNYDDPGGLGEFGTQPGMYFPTCMPCYDCDPLLPHTWSYLHAYCNECTDENIVPPCRPWAETDPSLDVIWTVELLVWGYWSAECGAGETLCWSLPTGCVGPYTKMIWAKTLPSSAAPHNYAGAHILTLRELSGCQFGEEEEASDPGEYYCQPPSTITLYAGVEPPAP